VNRYPKDLPVFLVSGANDPVGDFGVGVKKVYHMLRTAQMEDVTYRLYDEDRHEVLNELDKEQVYSDILAWMNIRLG
jgi:alpha-beta hydrolase superfamily lysophospholipase